MRWQKLAIYASVAWILFVVIVAVGLLLLIWTHPMGDEIDDMRAFKSGAVTGALLAFGLIAIWASLFMRHRKKSVHDESE